MKGTEPVKEKHKVVLETAYAWTCDCGQRNISEAAVLDMTPQEKREAIAQTEGVEIDGLELSDEELQALKMTTTPEVVQCSNCSMEFETEELTGDIKLSDMLGE